MEAQRWLPLFVVGLGGLWLASQAGVPVVGDVLPELVDVVERGARLTRAATDAAGRVTSSLDDLLAQAASVVGRDVDAQAYAAARMVRSEEGAAGQNAKRFLVHVMLNQAEAAGLDLLGVIQRHRDGSYFGPQAGGAVASGQDPYESDLVAAEYAIGERSSGDPTGGARKFVDKRAFGVQAGTGSFDRLVAKWAPEGLVPGTLDGAPASLVFFWYGSAPDFAGAV